MTRAHRFLGFAVLVLLTPPAAAGPGTQKGDVAAAQSLPAQAMLPPSAPIVRPLLREVPLLPADLAAQDLFGYAVAMDGNRLVVGSRNDDDNGSASGAAYVFKRGPGGWMEEAKLLASDGMAGDTFGAAVAIHGDTVVVGSPLGFFDAGAVYVFVRSGTTWTEQAKLVAGSPAGFATFGRSVAIEGDTILIGAPHPITVVPSIGEAYVFVRSGTTWMQEAPLVALDAAAGDWFGSSVSVTGDRAVVGASRDDDAGTDSGSAYVFLRNGSTWAQQAKLVPSPGAPVDRFGAAVSTSGDTIAVGAWGDDQIASGAGAAYVFIPSGPGWSLQAKLTAPDGAEGAIFGGALSLDGDGLVVGANFDDGPAIDSGSAYLFQRSAGSWHALAKLVASDGGTSASFGFSVGLHQGVVVVGANLQSATGTQSGKAYVYTNQVVHGAASGPAPPN